MVVYRPSKVGKMGPRGAGIGSGWTYVELDSGSEEEQLDGIPPVTEDLKVCFMVFKNMFEKKKYKV